MPASTGAVAMALAVSRPFRVLLVPILEVTQAQRLVAHRPTRMRLAVLGARRQRKDSACAWSWVLLLPFRKVRSP